MPKRDTKALTCTPIAGTVVERLRMAISASGNNTKSCFEKLITISHKLANDS